MPRVVATSKKSRPVRKPPNKSRRQRSTLKHGKRTPSRPASERRTGHEAEIGVLPGSDRDHLLSQFLRDLEKTLKERLTPERALGKGGMAKVEIAHDVLLERQVAKKTIHGHLVDNRRALFLFMREARITGQLDHPHIVPVYDVGRDTDGRLFFTMKRVSGRTLADVFSELPKGPLPRDVLLNVLDIFIKVCDAVAFAHSRGIIHCDLKPDNVMVGDFGQVYVMDWGIARVLKDRAADAFPAPDLKRHAVVSTFSVMGTPAYMSPEQVLGERSALDERTDIFSLGAVLYELFAGRPPYAAKTADQALALARFGDFQPLSKAAAQRMVPLGLERVVHRAMTVDRELRYQSVTALRADVEKYLREGAEFPLERFAAGTLIIREGDSGDTAYIIAQGRCEVFRGQGPERQVLRVLGPGDVFGEMALLSPGPRTANVAASRDTEVYVIARPYLEAELRYTKPWLANMLRTVADRFRNVDDKSAGRERARASGY
jgi:eukaryotic-like serine/threonine-protein kinase